jgi:hypothetical protein
VSGKSTNLLNVEFQRLTDGPLLAYVSSGHIAVRRKRALWVARAMAAAHRRALRRRMKEQRHGTS